MAGQLLRLTLLALSSLVLLNSAAQITRDKLSPQVGQIYDHILEQLKQGEEVSPTPKNHILTAGTVRKQLTQYGDTKDFVDKIFFEELVNAKEEVLMTTFIFDKNGPPTPVGIKDALIELNKRLGERKAAKKGLRFYLAFDPFGTAFFQKSMLPLDKVVITRSFADHPQKINLPDPDMLEYIDFKVLKFHKGVIGALHSKMMLIDGKTTIMGSKNMDGDTCMEFMFVMDGPVTCSLREDFKKVWKKPIPDLVTPPPEYNPDVHVPMLVVSRKHAAVHVREYAPQDQAWLKAIDVAEQHVYIQTPDFATKAIADAVVDAIVKKNIEVTIVTSFRQSDTVTAAHAHSYGTNGQTMNIMYEKLQKLKPSAVSRLKWCWFIGKRAGPNPQPKATEWSHVKFMSVDDKFAMAGSGNQDPQSWYHSRENNVLIDSPKIAVSMKNTLLEPQQSLKYCYTGAPGEKRAT